MGFNKKAYSGFNDKTANHLQLDAGAFFKDFDLENDTYESAKTDGKLIGATLNGGEFGAKPTFRQIPVDGVKGKAKGLEVIDQWDVYIKANVLEVTKDNLKLTLASGAEQASKNAAYDEIYASQYIVDSNYIGNITWVGTLSGYEKPLIIQIFNALNMEGLTLTTQDKNQAVLAMNFSGHYDTGDLDNPPFRIFYPKAGVEA